MIPAILLIAIVIAFAIWLFKKPALQTQPSIKTEKDILLKDVSFFKNLSEDDKENFLSRLRHFLDKVKITGVKTNVEDIDKVLIAAGAIIPIFAFKNWEYKNINEILLYPNSFGDDFKLSGESRYTLGMVGNGPMQNVMILSKEDVRRGFINEGGESNTTIHEFVHLVDKTDGDTDGLPSALLPHKYSLPWLKLMHEEIQKIKDGKSDIYPYGATNQAEFFAVVSEYFFKQPHLMQENHPELFDMLNKIFTTQK